MEIHQKQQKPRTANEKKEIKQASKAKQGKPKPRAYEKKTDQSRRIKGVILEMFRDVSPKTSKIRFYIKRKSPNFLSDKTFFCFFPPLPKRG